MWYIARTHDDAKKLAGRPRNRADGGKETRAVFFREELSGMIKTIEQLSPEERQDWLREMITIKKELGLATVTNFKTKRAKSSRF